ncbi:MAG: hypothetical protein D6767_02580 [Candidatus Hydrogenedentota bacterium]|nr:MAG: hypothetical protein D6767_02580 [Candidatus Hydrogenedentota bacterium]
MKKEVTKVSAVNMAAVIKIFRLSVFFKYRMIPTSTKIAIGTATYKFISGIKDSKKATMELTNKNQTIGYYARKAGAVKILHLELEPEFPAILGEGQKGLLSAVPQP